MQKASLVAMLLAVSTAASSEEALVVHIRCEGSSSQGTGVIVSETGHVLTAAHVMPVGALCTASIGSTEGGRMPILREREADGFDAILALLETDQRFSRFAEVCPARTTAQVLSYGFHADMTGPPRANDGIVSTDAPQTISDADIETQAIQVSFEQLRGESGGPVFLSGTHALVGIVLGGRYTATGDKSNWVVPVSRIPGFDLRPSANCEPRDAVGETAALLVQQFSIELAEVARVAGVQEAQIIALARRVAVDTDTFEQAIIELEYLVDTAINVQRRGAAPNEAGPFVEEVLQEVAALSELGQHDSASQRVETALAELEATETALRKARIELLQGGIDADLLRLDEEQAAARIVEKLSLQHEGEDDLLGALVAEYYRWLQSGQVKGVNQHLRVALALARELEARASSPEVEQTGAEFAAIALMTLGLRDVDNARLEEAIHELRSVIARLDRNAEPERWAGRMHNLGGALTALGTRQDGTAALEEAVAVLRASQDVWSPDRNPMQWVESQTHIAIALSAIGVRERGTARLLEAVSEYREALEFAPREAAPEIWADIQDSLAGALLEMGRKEDGVESLEQAEAALRSALEIRTRDNFPRDWTRSQTNLASVLSAIGVRSNDAARLEEAIDILTEVLDVISRERLPLVWANSQNDLGNALIALGSIDGELEHFENAVGAYRSALEERTKDRVPLEWGETQSNLANALSILGRETESLSRLDESAALYRAVADVMTRDDAPAAWADNLSALGKVSIATFELNGDEDLIYEGVRAHRDALKEATRDRWPGLWARIQSDLGRALYIRGRYHQRMEDLDAAIDAFHIAREVRTREDEPLDWATTTESLALAEATVFAMTGNPFYFLSAKQNFLAASEIYELASEWGEVERIRRNIGWLESHDPQAANDQQ